MMVQTMTQIADGKDLPIKEEVEIEADLSSALIDLITHPKAAAPSADTVDPLASTTVTPKTLATSITIY